MVLRMRDANVNILQDQETDAAVSQVCFLPVLTTTELIMSG